MDKKYPLGVIASAPDYRQIPLSEVQVGADDPTVTLTEFQNDYSMIPVIDQNIEPDCATASAKAYVQKIIFDATGKLPDISSEAWYQIARMYAGLAGSATNGVQPAYADVVAQIVGLIGQSIVPEDRELSPEAYGASLDITLAMITDAFTKKITGTAIPNLTQTGILNAIQNNKGILMVIDIDEDWYNYVPGQQNLNGNGAEIGLHRTLLTGFRTGPDGEIIIHGRNSWGTEWGMAGDFEFPLAAYLSKMSEPVVYPIIPAEVLANVHTLPQQPIHTFGVTLYASETSADITALQNILKYEGLFPLGTNSNGVYGPLTTAAVLAFQERYAISDLNTLGALDGKTVGPLTIAKLNELYGAPYSANIIKWAFAAQAHEGYFTPGQNAACPNGSLSWRNKNPGNFKFTNQPNATLASINGEEWACFDTYTHGFDYLCDFFYNSAMATSGEYYGSMTLLEFYQVYSPDGTAPQYAAEIASALGVEVTTPISSLI